MGALEATQPSSQPCLIEQARSDKTAFAALFRRHHDEIYRYCARRLPNQATAEDVTSQVFLKMVKKFNSFMGNEKAFRCWLYRIACNEINSYFRQAGRQTRVFEKIQQDCPTEMPDTTDDCDQADENEQQMTFLKNAIDTLKPTHQDIISLRFYEGLNSEQIGNILEMKPATVRSQLARALKKLQDLYKNRQQQTSEELCWYE